MEDTPSATPQIWGGDDSAVRGIGFRAPRPLHSPNPLRRPRILGGGIVEQIRNAVLTRISLSETGGERVASGGATMSLARAVDKLAGVGVDTAAVGNDVDESFHPLLPELVRQVEDL